MDKRFLLFLVGSFLLLTINMAWNARNMPRRPVAAQGAGAAAEGAAAGENGPAAGGAAGQPAADAGAAVEDAEATENDAEVEGDAADGDEAPAPEPRPDVPVEFVTLGSVDPASPYRMLATITNVGAAVQRVEMASPRYRDLHDQTGYLGHLEPTTATGDGVLVNAVGAGTPADKAGVKVGDVLLQAGVKELTDLSSPADLARVLSGTKRRDALQLVVQRNGEAQPLKLTAELARRPLEVIRPESENVLMRGAALPAGFVEPPSFLLTLDQIDVQTLKPDAVELPGVDLTTAHWTVERGAADDEVAFECLLPEQGLKVTKRFRLAKVDAAQQDNRDAPAYHLTMEITIANAGDRPRKIAYRLEGPNGLPIEGWWYATKVGRTSTGMRDVLARYFTQGPEEQGPTAIITGEAATLESGSLAYIGVDAQYFASALLPEKKDPNTEWIQSARSIVQGPMPPENRPAEFRYANVSYRLRSKPQTIAAGGELTHKYTVFAGPKRPQLLEQYVASKVEGYTLNDFVYYGWFGFVARPMIGILHIFYAAVGNYGVAIVMLTALVKSLMFPINRRMAKNMAHMQAIKPELDRIKERYKGDQQKMAQAQQQLFKKHDVNPLGGCLPMLLQFPVFIGLYRGLAVDIELRQAPLIGWFQRWCSNLAAPDMFYDWSWFMPRFISSGEHIWIFPGIGPYLNLLPLVTLGLYLWQQHTFMPPPTNEQAAMQQKMMKYMMFVMVLFFYKVPSGLCLYFIASSLWGIGERKLFPPPTAESMGLGASPTPPSGKPGSAADDRRAAKAAANAGKAKRRK